MVSGFFNILRHLVLKRQHSRDIQSTRPCNQILLVRVLPRELIAD